MANGEQQTGMVRVEPSPHPLTLLVQVPAEVVMYNVTEQDLDTIAAGGNVTVSSILFGSSIGAVIVFLVALMTTEMSDRILAVFWALFVVALLATLAFGARFYFEARQITQRVAAIKARRHSAVSLTSPDMANNRPR